jgi:hypothetical protein
VVCFDLDNSFTSFPLPDYFECVHELYPLSSPFNEQIYDCFQRALTLLWYYRLHNSRPLYFSSFLLLPGFESRSEPFLFRKVPVRRGSSLAIRTTLQGAIDVLVDYRRPVPPGSFVLLPPHEHPFRVIGRSGDELQLCSVDRNPRTINARSTLFVWVTRPNLLLNSIFRSPPLRQNHVFRMPPDAPDLYDIAPDAIEGFLQERFPAHFRSDDEDFDECVEFPAMTPAEILSQVVLAADKRSLIEKCIGTNDIFPSKRSPLRFFVSSFLSFFRFDFGFSDVRPPYYARSLMDGCDFAYERLGIPNVIVNCGGSPREVSADVVVERWESERFAPISGPKSGHFIVVVDSTIDMNATRVFFSQFCHIYKQFQFGNLSPFPRFEAFYSVPVGTIPTFISDFFRDQKLTEFQCHPVLTFVVGPQVFDTGFHPPSFISYVRPESVRTASTEELRTFAFVVYARTRIFAPVPYGMIDIAPAVSSSYCFGFRYQPPFLRPRHDPILTIHIGWDPELEVSAWTDDIGSILHYLPGTPLPKLSQLMQDACQSLTPTQVRFTLAVFGEGITMALQNMLESVFASLHLTVRIFAIAPQPNVQATFSEEFDDDAIVFDTPEQSRNGPGEFVTPDATCFVVARHLPAYSVSYYARDARKPPDEILREHVREWSHITWLSVKPGSEKRTIAYPFQIVVLIRKTSPLAAHVSRYEFLPSTERI